MEAVLAQCAELPEPGRLYQHYKGKFYRVITLARLATEGKPWVVVYKDVARHADVPEARDLAEFQHVVRWPDGRMRGRFVHVTAVPNTLRDLPRQLATVEK